MRKEVKWINATAIAAGAVAGTWLRYFVNLITFSSEYPVGTLVENSTGSLILGFVTGLFMHKVTTEWLRLGLTVGLCGGFTTMSAFAADGVNLLVNQEFGHLFLYLFLSTAGGLFCAWGGYALGNRYGRNRRGVVS